MTLKEIQDKFSHVRPGAIFQIGDTDSLYYTKLFVTKSDSGYRFTGDGSCSPSPTIPDLIYRHDSWDNITYFQDGKFHLVKGKMHDLSADDFVIKMRVIRD
jgi:hypothetical protein